MTTKRQALCGLLGVILAASGGEAVAAPKTSLKCRAKIAGSVAKLTRVGLAEINACHKQRDKGRTDRDCNVLAVGDVSTKYGQTANRANFEIGSACKPDNPVRGNYPGGDVVNVLFPAVTALLEGAGEVFMGAPVFVGDPQTVKALGKCHKAIGTGRANVINDVLKSANKCQKKLDQTADTLAAIADQCLPTSSKAGGRAAAAMSRSCGSFAGSQVGSCDGLPGCVVDGSVETGRLLARLTYGGPTVCGNGELEPLAEECDDGNTDSTDACTAACKVAVCGDGFVQAGVEECDDANTNPNDGCDVCRVPVIPPVTCGGAGMLVTLAVPYDAARLAPARVASGTFALAYPGALGIPGAGVTTDQTRVTDLTGGTAIIANDQDGTLSLTAATPDGFPSGDLARILFDCTPGTEVRTTDFGCVTTNPSDELGNPLSPDDVPCRVSALEAPGGGATTTTSTTTPPTTTTSTTIPENCGNNVTEGTETCDDGNNSDNDACPADCRVDPCTAIPASDRTVQASFSGPAPIASMQFLLDYPEGKVSVPGSGGSIPAGIVTNQPSGATVSTNDFDHAVRLIVASAFNFGASGPLVRIHFETCQGAPIPTAGDFICTVLAAEDAVANPVGGVTCSVTIL